MKQKIISNVLTHARKDMLIEMGWLIMLRERIQKQMKKTYHQLVMTTTKP